MKLWHVLVIVGIPFIGCTGGIAAYKVNQWTGADGREATSQVPAFAKKMGIAVSDVECMAQDSDTDGYVSCTVFGTQDGKRVTQSVECTGSWTFNEGCRIPKIQGAVQSSVK